MQTAHRPERPVYDRTDTLLGICEAMGQDFGFNPLVLRIAFGVSLLWNPLASIAVYGALGIAVLASRLLFPPRRAPADVTGTVVEQSIADNDDQAHSRAMAA